MKNFWKILAITLIGGIACESIFCYITISRLSRDNLSLRSERDAYVRSDNQWDVIYNNLERERDGLRELQNSDRAIIADLRRERDEYRKQIFEQSSGAGSANSESYERAERIQEIFRELARRLGEDGDLE